MMEDAQTPSSDCNSNPSDPISQDLIGSEFIQDNSDYQWFIDYGYRDGGGLHVHPSVLSSLSTSYTQDDLGYYDDLARNLDANLAEVDMESFRTSDIHTLLTALPVMCTDPVDQSEFNYQRERYASISGSVMEKINIGSSISPHSSSQGEDSACSTTDTISICKSSLLFSPVRETPVLPPGGSYSVDSLDCEDMLLTCQTNNKNNYTIAFEGSITMYSDGSQDFESQDKPKISENRENFYNSKIHVKNISDMSMACSDSKIYTTWSNLKHSSANKIMTRHGSGNNNTIPNFLMNATIGQKFRLQTDNKIMQVSRNNTRSLSLPDLRKSSTNLEPMNVPLNFSIDSGESHQHNIQTSGSAVMSRSVNDNCTNSSTLGKKLQNMSLVKLFMKQKSMSAEGMSLTLDQSDSTSENIWPTNNNNSNSNCNSNSNSNSNSESNSTTNTNTQIHRNKINNSKSNISENDFTINWVKTECYKNNDTSTNDPSSSNNTSKRISCSMNEFKEESPSVEELSESLIKSEGDLDDKINNETRHLKKKSSILSRTTGIQAITEVEENGVQTSLLYVIPPKNNFPCLRETLVDRKPVYVVYPNYTLPDLSFFKAKETKLGNISLKPHERIRWQNKNNGGTRGNRPFSCNDIDALKQRGFSHIKDWESLTFLLPTEYKKILNDVPEIPKHIKLCEDTRKPLFCLSPPMRQRSNRADINSDITTTNVSSSSSNGTQPSSGYRGSSTILTDSSINQHQQSNPLYLYRYDSMSSENSLINHEKKYRLNHPVAGLLSEKRSISLPQGDKDNSDYVGKVPPRPPLPRSILRKTSNNSNKRYSMFEMGELDETDNCQSVESNKRISLHEPYYINNDLQSLRHGRIMDSDKDVDEVEERRYAEKIKESGQFLLPSEDKLHTNAESSREDIKQLDEFLKLSGFSSNSSEDGCEDQDVKLRSYVRKFLSLKMNKDLIKPGELELDCTHQKKVSFAVNQRKTYLNSRDEDISINRIIFNRDENDKNDKIEEFDEIKSIEIADKIKFINEVNRAVDILIMYWQSSSKDYDKNNECAQLCLTNLCPTLYAIMLDGLKPHLNSSFGQISNSVWQVVEVSSQQGPLTNTLNELVQKINSEDFITESILKFHAFVFGLLNLRALDAWFAYLCTRESILRKHYTTSSLFVAALGCANSREIINNFLTILQPLAFCPFQLDLLYQYRQLHNSFTNMNCAARTSGVDLSNENKFEKTIESPSVSSIKNRPRSCGSYQDNISNIVNPECGLKKRWSNLTIGSKFTLDDSEDYTDSLEYSPLNRKTRKPIQKAISPDAAAILVVDNEEPDKNDHVSQCVDSTIPGELKFRKLQEKWELMVTKEESPKEALSIAPVSLSSPNQQNPMNVGKSRIPRLLNSPIKQQPSNIMTIVSKTKSPVTGIPTLKKSQATGKLASKKSTPDIKTIKELSRRTSRVDQEHVNSARLHLTRPSSLPYKSQGVMAKEKNLISPQRRAASTSLPRPNSLATAKPSIQSKKRPLKEVRTLSHRLPSDNGHLSFNEGDKLKVILEVDNKWLLCAKGDRKGLVPRSCVHAYQT